MNLYDKVVSSVARSMTWMGVCVLTAMMILACADVLLRYFGHPITGAFDVTRVLGALVYSLPVACACIEGYQVAVDSVFARAPSSVRIIVDSIVCLASMVTTVMVAWCCIDLGHDLYAQERVTDTIPIPLWPLLVVVAFGFFLYSLVVLAKHLNSLKRTDECR